MKKTVTLTEREARIVVRALGWAAEMRDRRIGEWEQTLRRKPSHDRSLTLCQSIRGDEFEASKETTLIAKITGDLDS